MTVGCSSAPIIFAKKVLKTTARRHRLMCSMTDFRELKERGNLLHTLRQIVAFDEVV